MGKTKTKIIDDSKPQEAQKKKVVEPTNKGKVKSATQILEPTNKGKIKSAKEIIAPKVEAKEAKKETKVSRKIRGKKYQRVEKQIDRNKKYRLDEAVELTQKVSYAKFGGSIEAHINTAVKNIRGSVSLPHLSGKKLIILGFGQGAKEAGADLEGDDQTIANIEKNKINFDVIVASPQWMPKLAKVAKILGPRGLMPNPKNDTVTDDLSKVIAELRAGKTEYKTEKDGKVIHLVVGKVSQPSEEVRANVKALYNTIGKGKIQKITLAPTMGPGVKVELNSI